MLTCVQPFKQQLGGVTGTRLSHASMAACVLSTTGEETCLILPLSVCSDVYMYVKHRVAGQHLHAILLL